MMSDLSMQSRHSLLSRFRPLVWFVACFLVVAFVTRLILLWMTGAEVPPSPGNWLYVFGVGLGYDLVTVVYAAWPLVVFLWLVPTRRGRLSAGRQWLLYALALALLCGACLGFLRWHFNADWKTAWPVLLPFLYALPLAAFTSTSRTGQWMLRALCLLLLFGLLFVAVSELTFWDEFGTRFNFIAVDYLIYTREVIGNIEESYPIGRWLTMLAIAAVIIVALSRRSLRTEDDTSRFGARSLVVLGWLVLTVIVTVSVNSGMKERMDNTYVNSLAGNGIYEFFAAFRNSNLNFHRFYRTLPDDKAYAIVRQMLQTPDAHFVSEDPHDLTRAIRHVGPERHLNVVLISVESLSADYLGVFGNPQGLTPNLDKLASQSLFFENTYANGTRTVRGLEALALSVPPTPGDSLVKQPHNEGLFSLAGVFNQRGYVSEFVYGGYGYFDNMNAFFGNDGYRAIDRRDIPATATIHSENVWGVADEDLYTLAMAQMDSIHDQDKPFFVHIMTTSNHRPYTWPAGRVPMAQGTRGGAVQYTDWAIGDFIARMRVKPYFRDTVFVITADHCAASAGRTRIPLNRYHIPLYIYSPAHIRPRRVARMVSQIDIPPTLLGLLNFSYRSRFFGRDIFSLPRGEERAYPSTYQNLGYLSGQRLTVLSPRRKVEQVKPDPATGGAAPYPQLDPTQLDQAVAIYQVAYDEFVSGRMHWRESDATPVPPLPVPASSARAPSETTRAATNQP